MKPANIACALFVLTVLVVMAIAYAFSPQAERDGFWSSLPWRIIVKPNPTE